MSNQTEAPMPQPAHALMHLRIPVHTPSRLAARASKRAEHAMQVETHGLRVHEWQLNVSAARVSPSIVPQPSASRRSATDTSSKAFFHAANAFETHVATLLMYNAARVKRM
jgi:hypothetical protein